jgi:hypothetical protein
VARSVAIPASMRRALADLKAGPKGREAHLGAILVPRPVSLDEWESHARPQQAALMQASTDGHVAARLGPAEAVSDGSLLSTAVRAKEAPKWIRS